MLCLHLIFHDFAMSGVHQSFLVALNLGDFAMKGMHEL